MLFDQIHGMDLLTDALEGARFVLAVLGETIPSRASLVHLYDASRRAFVVVAARGEQKDSMILSRQDGRDPLLRALMPGGRPFAWRNLREVSIRGIPRFAELSHIDSVVAAPVSIGSRWMGVIELVDPLSRGGNGLGTAEENGLAYVADRYAAYLSTRGVIVDVAEIARFALTS